MRVPLGHVTITELMDMPKDNVAEVRRFEVFTGVGRRRLWSSQDKARIVGESNSGEESVSGVARRHGLSPAQLFGWRRAARALAHGQGQAPLFVPAVVTPMQTERLNAQRQTGAERARAAIELEIDGVKLRVGRGVDARTMTVVLRALKNVR